MLESTYNVVEPSKGGIFLPEKPLGSVALDAAIRSADLIKSKSQQAKARIEYLNITNSNYGTFCEQYIKNKKLNGGVSGVVEAVIAHVEELYELAGMYTDLTSVITRRGENFAQIIAQDSELGLRERDTYYCVYKRHQKSYLLGISDHSRPSIFASDHMPEAGYRLASHEDYRTLLIDLDEACQKGEVKIRQRPM